MIIRIWCTPGYIDPPPTTQQPRIPTWVVGLWPAPKSMRRSARWDGWLPNFKTPDAGVDRPDKAQLTESVAWLREERARLGLTMDGYDVVMEGNTAPGDEAVAEARDWERAGATWWLEANWEVAAESSVSWSRERLRAGPPRPAP